ncbi:MAG: ROK family protein [Limimaricola sp.]|uniref:ROK family transcriptional regulator n=1 Tax=Limimaricola sp. TaxID=2211665 RepID=UPI001D4588B1|nr:ROK family transcriptional regulator [Limimaricola sp.]MBI1416754.1 ROK family protein [Limimaricola sp.]
MNAPGLSIAGSNAERTRLHNRRVVLGCIHAAGGMGRAAIARASGLTTQTVSNIIAELLSDGLLQEGGRVAEGRGLPVVKYTINPLGALAFGAEVRPKTVLSTLMDMEGRMLASDRQPLEIADIDHVARILARMRDAAIKATGLPAGKLIGAGIVLPGPFGATGLTGRASDLPDWPLDLARTRIEQELGLPVVLENDANAAAVAERVSGAAQGLSSFAYVYFGTGLGLGVVERGQLIKGAQGNAGEIGHVPVPFEGQAVPLESVVSRLALGQRLAEAGVTVTSVEDIARLHSAGHPALTHWIAEAAGPLSSAVQMIENLFDPETVILGGAMPDGVLDDLIAACRPGDRSVAARPGRRLPRLCRGASGRMTATLGGAALVISRVFTPHLADTTA